jgi:2-(3-amino-3-carboxypropyl)histidine synthase
VIGILLGWRKDREIFLKISGYNIDLEDAVKTINQKKYKKIVLQIPEGLKTHAFRFVDFLETKTKATIIVSADPCFGACDIPYDELKNLGVEFVIQIGHLPIPNISDFSIPMVFINVISDKSVENVIEKTLSSLVGKKIGLVTTAQHVHTLDDVSKLLTKNGYKPVIGKGDNRISHNGQILGCNFSSAKSIAEKVDMFLFIGSGNFHPLGIILSTKKPVITCDPFTNEVKFKELNDLKDMILRQRYGAIARSKDAKVFGVLISTKRGQQRMKLAESLKKTIESHGKKSYFLVLNFVSPSFVESFRDIDCFVSTACPRIAIDDYMQYKTPMITPFELSVLLGEKEWDDYCFDEVID